MFIGYSLAKRDTTANDLAAVDYLLAFNVKYRIMCYSLLALAIKVPLLSLLRYPQQAFVANPVETVKVLEVVNHLSRPFFNIEKVTQ